MPLATQRYVERRIRDGRQPQHGRRLDAVSGSRGLTTDYVYVGGKRLEVPPRTTNFLKVYLDGSTAPEWVNAMPETQDSNAEVYDVTKNHIHLPANFAGG